jgi:hypothetical protein
MTFTCQTLSSSTPHSNRAHGIGLHMHSAAPSLPALVLPSWLVKVISTPNISILRLTSLLSTSFDSQLHFRHPTSSNIYNHHAFARITVCTTHVTFRIPDIPSILLHLVHLTTLARTCLLFHSDPQLIHGHFGLCFDHHETTDFRRILPF